MVKGSFIDVIKFLLMLTTTRRCCNPRLDSLPTSLDRFWKQVSCFIMRYSLFLQFMIDSGHPTLASDRLFQADYHLRSVWHDIILDQLNASSFESGGPCEVVVIPLRIQIISVVVFHLKSTHPIRWLMLLDDEITFSLTMTLSNKCLFLSWIHWVRNKSNRALGCSLTRKSFILRPSHLRVDVCSFNFEHVRSSFLTFTLSSIQESPILIIALCPHVQVAALSLDRVVVVLCRLLCGEPTSRSWVLVC